MAARASACAASATRPSICAGATTMWQMLSFWIVSTVGYATTPPSSARTTMTASSLVKGTHFSTYTSALTSDASAVGMSVGGSHADGNDAANRRSAETKPAGVTPSPRAATRGQDRGLRTFGTAHDRVAASVVRHAA